MADDIVDKLRWRIRCRAVDGRTWEEANDDCRAADEIERLRTEVKLLRVSLALAVGDLSTRDEYANVGPELLMHGFLIRGMEEADRD